ncbi:hypothetical protein TNCT_159011 [Trichonephila clavata]|uniref:Endonuclease/exonuclease/phosphatase domain-containing protein n=1 Tax=Trichonephila clavata TaxID=2740835 RepID=A0A8X6F939_TRICU|nr:hypothetical protein TNCT_159011 [Trichonephila clavata]
MNILRRPSRRIKRGCVRSVSRGLRPKVDFNAKHPLWGSSLASDGGNELLNLLDENAFCVLNDGTPIYCSHSYDSRNALDVAFACPDIFTSCS